MKTLDYIYETYLIPIVQMVSELVVYIVTILLTAVFIVTAPIWIIPYLIVKRRKENRDANE